MILRTKLLTSIGLAAIAAPFVLIGVSHGSDHADTPEIAASPGADITDVFMFESPESSRKVDLVMNVHPLIGPGKGPTTYFDPNVLYQFKLDTDGDAVEDLVIQAKFSEPGPHQKFFIVGPVKPETIGGSNKFMRDAVRAVGEINKATDCGDFKVYCGAREDPFFFDLEQFFNIFPDRATPLTGVAISNPDTPREAGFRPPGEAVDFLSNGGYNVLSIIVELPKERLRGRGGYGASPSGVVGMWTTTNVKHGEYYDQLDRLARPVVNEVFATVANGRHKINDLDQPRNDSEELAEDIQGFMTYPAGRSQATTNVVESVLVPDVMKINLDGTGSAYLGYETGGATGGTFGGRKLTDDVVDISLGIVFGKTVSALGLAPDDHKELPSFESDNVGDGGKHFLKVFPYLGNPR